MSSGAISKTEDDVLWNTELDDSKSSSNDEWRINKVAHEKCEYNCHEVGVGEKALFLV